MNCKICGKNLYQDITFSNLFKRNYKVHNKCKNKLQFSSEVTYLPLSNKYIIVDSLFDYVNTEFDANYLENQYIHLAFERMFKDDEWSMALYLNVNDINTFNNIDYEILFSLSKNNIYIISIDRKLIYHLENNLD